MARSEKTKQALANQRISEARGCPFCTGKQWKVCLDPRWIFLVHEGDCLIEHDTYLFVMSKDCEKWNKRANG